MKSAVHSSAKHDWGTPPEVFDRLNKEFEFDIDLAASAKNALLPDYFSEDDDSLKQDWHKIARTGVGFCNPPYKRVLQTQFIAKAEAERRLGFTTVMLLPARTDTRAFHKYIWNEYKNKPRCGVEIRFLKGRLKFVGADDGAPFPSMIVIFRPKGVSEWS